MMVDIRQTCHMVSPTSSRQTGVSPQTVPCKSTGWMVALRPTISMWQSAPCARSLEQLPVQSTKCEGA
eukprot:1161400-Pelagomonas_calceolata.AAC.6